MTDSTSLMTTQDIIDEYLVFMAICCFIVNKVTEIRSFLAHFSCFVHEVRTFGRFLDNCVILGL